MIKTTFNVTRIGELFKIPQNVQLIDSENVIIVLWVLECDEADVL